MSGRTAQLKAALTKAKKDRDAASEAWTQASQTARCVELELHNAQLKPYGLWVGIGFERFGYYWTIKTPWFNDKGQLTGVSAERDKDDGGTLIAVSIAPADVLAGLDETQYVKAQLLNQLVLDGSMDPFVKYQTDGTDEAGAKMWMATFPGFVNLQESPAGFDVDKSQALENLKAAALAHWEKQSHSLPLKLDYLMGPNLSCWSHIHVRE